ncbi:C40 family peptidase [Simiduia sp. 21SJ11W-1]|uniref:C40 family peptidase n=1 Tax=Simiduia sp. 21SJ11W-1 TaxID=2909669 RepID=UPI00209EABE8|nr:NlpC/P60 family protein [Simiduia sp. 21SJ11W-1]UTA48383.1 C40 family peptidase [Simiduia sp. 21SJ11W-1]
MMRTTLTRLLLLPLLCTLLACATTSKPTMGDKLVAAAKPWNEQPFRVGAAEQCMNWTREVLVAACGEKFHTLETQKPWDAHLLGPDDKLLPEHADSLAGDELGTRIDRIEDLQAGDLVFFKNTYGNWAEGVITHVGIALGDGNYIHRMTSHKGIVKTEPIPAADFASGIRLNSELCQ